HRGFLLTTKIEEIYKKNYVDYILYILEYIGCKIENKQLELYNTFETKKFDYIFENNNPVIGITYTSITNDARRWPVEYVINLAEMLVEKGYKVVILGKSNRHKEINKPFVYDLVNKTTLLEFIFIVKKLEQYISVATGGIHIAAAAGIKTIGIYIPGDEIGWAPYSDKTKILTRYTKCAPCNQHKMKYCKNNLCMQLVKPEDVLDLVRLP
ncbi:MAG: glycosyltransferase family 9 protein, partial [Endomicrobia bacterium]|nr:glycosyltransferase family 9 protein [Endomicrobiia bacterium]